MLLIVTSGKNLCRVKLKDLNKNINKNQKPEIVRPDQYFETVIWTGDGGSGKDVKVGFEPDFVWVKGRNHSQNHLWHDNVRGLNNYLKWFDEYYD